MGIGRIQGKRCKENEKVFPYLLSFNVWNNIHAPKLAINQHYYFDGVCMFVHRKVDLFISHVRGVCDLSKSNQIRSMMGNKRAESKRARERESSLETLIQVQIQAGY